MRLARAGRGLEPHRGAIDTAGQNRGRLVRGEPAVPAGGVEQRPALPARLPIPLYWPRDPAPPPHHHAFVPPPTPGLGPAFHPPERPVQGRRPGHRPRVVPGTVTL